AVRAGLDPLASPGPFLRPTMERNINFILLGDNLPDWAEANIERFSLLNPDWNVLVHGAEFDMPEVYRAALKRAVKVGAQSDVLRLAALETFGGWYFDWDVWAIRPIDQTQSAALIGDKLLLWRYPQAGGMCGSSICAAAKESKAWPIIHDLMAVIAAGDAPDPDYFEQFICNAMRKQHPREMTTGVDAEFTVTGKYLADKVVYRHLLAGEPTVDLGQCAFLHGWADTSKLPAVVLGE
ncbi:MAG: glycosyltransferase, partial [Candidatus Cryosericum sp.]